MIADKLNCLNDLTEKLGRCQSLEEQLTLFSSKCQPLIKQIIRDVKESDEEIFTQLSQFLHCMIFDTEFIIELEVEKEQQTQEEAAADESNRLPESVQVHDKPAQ